MLRDGEGRAEVQGREETLACEERCERRLGARLETFLLACQVRSAEAGELLQVLSEYVTHDLPAEEARIRALRAPGTEEHLADHAELRRIFAELVKAYARYGNDPRVAREVRARALGWLDEHVRKDRELCNAIAARGCADAPIHP